MKRNLTEIEQRMIVILKKDSRKSISDLSKELGISRITAKKAMDNLIAEKKIKSFTVTVDDDLRDMVLVHVNDLTGVPLNRIVEYFELIDQTFMLVMYYEDLLDVENLPILDVKVVRGRVLGDNPGRLAHLHCDYCGNDITGKPIIVEVGGRTYYACCPTCERDLRKRREILSNA
ncbi:MAG: TRASH domain-containing protein [Thermoplasmatales archaeon]|nr:TRASH domain-containing protein [Thermoplasmatales archaeon]